MKLSQPNAAILTYLAWSIFAWLIPKETLGADNKHPEGPPHIGTGPYMYDNFTPGVGASFKKHPNYFLTGKPYVDALRRLVIPDTSTVLANFRSGKLDVTTIAETDIDSVRQANPKATYIQYPEPALETFYFGEGIVNPPFNDVRARQAVSMALDRDALLKASYAGKGEWSTMFPPRYSPWWLDPRGKDFGNSARLFKKNNQDAKQLLAAAGHPDGLTLDLNVTFDYGAPAKERYELVASMLKEIGINATLKSKEYAAYQSTTSLGKFDGLAYGPYANYPDPDGFLSNYWLSSSARRKSKWVDPALDAMIRKQVTLFDGEQRKQVIWDIQRLTAEKAYAPPGVAGLLYAANQPTLKNYFPNIDYGATENSIVEAWIDQS
jgi:ABC-type transport system substrate-binding protein